MGLKSSGHSADFFIQRLNLAPHPEGGYFRQTYCAETNIAASALPQGFSGARAASTAIYFLLRDGEFSAFHRIRSDELWHFYAGDPLEVITLQEGRAAQVMILGPDIAAGQAFQGVVRAGHWFASRLLPGGAYALAGCTVAPGFHFDDFEMARQEELVRLFPQSRMLIEQLTQS